MGLGTNWGITVSINVAAMNSFTKSSKALEAGAVRLESVGQKANAMIDSLGKTLTGRVNELNAAINSLKSTVNDPKLKGALGRGGSGGGAGFGFELPKFNTAANKARKAPRDFDSYLSEHLGFPAGTFKTSKKPISEFQSLVGRMPKPSRETKDRGKHFDSAQAIVVAMKGAVTVPIVNAIELMSDKISKAICALNLPPQGPPPSGSQPPPSPKRPKGPTTMPRASGPEIYDVSPSRAPPAPAPKKRRASKEPSASSSNPIQTSSAVLAREAAAAERAARVASRTMDVSPKVSTRTKPPAAPIAQLLPKIPTDSARQARIEAMAKKAEKEAEIFAKPTQGNRSSSQTSKKILAEIAEEVAIDKRVYGPSGGVGRKAMINEAANVAKTTKPATLSIEQRAQAALNRAQAALDRTKARVDSPLHARVTTLDDTSHLEYGDYDNDKTKKKGPPTPAQQFGNAMKRVVNWGSAAILVYGGAQKIEEAIKQMADFDEEMTKVRRSMMSFSGDFNQVSQGIVKIGETYGVDINEAAKAAQTFTKQGEGVNAVLRDTAIAAMATNTTELNLTEATEGLIAAQREFIMGAGSGLRVLDSWTQIERTTAVGANVLADATKAAGTASRSAGIDFDQFNGIVGAVGEQTKKSGDTIGTAMKFIFQHTRDVKAVEALQQAGVYSEDAAGNFKSARQTLGELAGKWDKLSDAQRNNIGLSVAGTEHLNDFITMMETWDRSIDLSVVSMTSQGAAMRANQITMESLNKHVAALKQSFAGLFAEFGNSGMIATMTTMVDMAKGMIGAFNSVNKFSGGFVSTLAAGGAVAGGVGMASAWLGGTVLPNFMGKKSPGPAAAGGALASPSSLAVDGIVGGMVATPEEEAAEHPYRHYLANNSHRLGMGMMIGAGALQYGYNQFGRQSIHGEAPTGRDTAVDMGATALEGAGLAKMLQPAEGFMKGGKGGKAVLAAIAIATAAKVYSQYQIYAKANTANSPENATDQLTKLQKYQDVIANTKGKIRLVQRQQAGGGDVDTETLQSIRDEMQAIDPASKNASESLADFIKRLNDVNGKLTGQGAAINAAAIKAALNSPEIQQASSKLSQLQKDQDTDPNRDSRLNRAAEIADIREKLNGANRDLLGNMVARGHSGEGMGDFGDIDNTSAVTHKNSDENLKAAIQKYFQGLKTFDIKPLDQLSKAGVNARDLKYYKTDDGNIHDIHDANKVVDKKTVGSNFVLDATDKTMTMQVAMVQAKNINQLVNQYERAIDKLTNKSSDLVRSVTEINQNLTSMSLSAAGDLIGGREDLAAHSRQMQTYGDIASRGARDFSMPEMSTPKAAQSAMTVMMGQANQQANNAYGIAPAGHLNVVSALEKIRDTNLTSNEKTIKRIIASGGTNTDESGDEKAETVKLIANIGQSAKDVINELAMEIKEARDKKDFKKANTLSDQAISYGASAERLTTDPQIQKNRDAARDQMRRIVAESQGSLTSLGVGYSRSLATGKVANAAGYANTPEAKNVLDQMRAAADIAKDLVNQQTSRLQEMAKGPGGRDSEDYKSNELFLKTLESDANALSDAFTNAKEHFEHFIVGMDKVNLTISRMTAGAGMGAAFGQTGLNSDAYAINFLTKEMNRLGNELAKPHSITERADINKQIDTYRTEALRHQTNVELTKDYRAKQGEGLLTNIIAGRLQSAVGLPQQGGIEEYRQSVAAEQTEMLQKIAADLAPAMQGKSSMQVMQITEQMKPMLTQIGAKVHDMMLDANVEFRKQYLLASPSQRLVADSMRQQMRQGSTAEEIFSDPYTRGAAKDNPMFGELVTQALDNETQIKALDYQNQTAENTKRTADLMEKAYNGSGGINQIRQGAGLNAVPVPSIGTDANRLAAGSMARAGSGNIDKQGRIKRDWTPAYLDKGEVVLNADQSSDYLRRRNRFANGTGWDSVDGGTDSSPWSPQGNGFTVSGGVRVSPNRQLLNSYRALSEQTGGSVVADFKNSPLEIEHDIMADKIRSVTDRMKEIHKRYPKIKSLLRGSSVDSIFHDSSFVQDNASGQTGGGAYYNSELLKQNGYVSPSAIAVATDRTNQQRMALAGSNNSVSKDLADVFTHEFGHHIFSRMEKDDPSAYKDFQNIHAQQTPARIERTISSYANKSFSEYAAESFLLSTKKDGGDRLPESVKNFFDEHLGRPSPDMFQMGGPDDVNLYQEAMKNAAKRAKVEGRNSGDALYSRGPRQRLGRKNIIATEAAKLWGRAARNPALDGPALRLNFLQEEQPWQQALLLGGQEPVDQPWDQAFMLDDPLYSRGPKERSLTRSWLAGRNNGKIVFESQLQQDLFDLGKHVSVSAQSGYNPKTPAGTISDITSRISEKFGGDQFKMQQAALETRKSIREQMKGIKDGETRTVRSVSTGPAPTPRAGVDEVVAIVNGTPVNREGKPVDPYEVSPTGTAVHTELPPEIPITTAPPDIAPRNPNPLRASEFRQAAIDQAIATHNTGGHTSLLNRRGNPTQAGVKALQTVVADLSKRHPHSMGLKADEFTGLINQYQPKIGAILDANGGIQKGTNASIFHSAVELKDGKFVVKKKPSMLFAGMGTTSVNKNALLSLVKHESQHAIDEPWVNSKLYAGAPQELLKLRADFVDQLLNEQAGDKTSIGLRVKRSVISNYPEVRGPKEYGKYGRRILAAENNAAYAEIGNLSNTHKARNSVFAKASIRIHELLRNGGEKDEIHDVLHDALTKAQKLTKDNGSPKMGDLVEGLRGPAVDLPPGIEAAKAPKITSASDYFPTFKKWGTGIKNAPGAITRGIKSIPDYITPRKWASDLRELPGRAWGSAKDGAKGVFTNSVAGIKDMLGKDLMAPTEGGHGFGLKSGAGMVGVMVGNYLLNKYIEKKQGEDSNWSEHGVGKALTHYVQPGIGFGFDLGNPAFLGSMVAKVGGATAAGIATSALAVAQTPEMTTKAWSGLNRILKDTGAISERTYREGVIGTKNTELMAENASVLPWAGKNAYRVGANSVNYLRGKGYDSSAQHAENELVTGRGYLSGLKGDLKGYDPRSGMSGVGKFFDTAINNASGGLLGTGDYTNTPSRWTHSNEEIRQAAVEAREIAQLKKGRVGTLQADGSRVVTNMYNRTPEQEQKYQAAIKEEQARQDEINRQKAEAAAKAAAQAAAMAKYQQAQKNLAVVDTSQYDEQTKAAIDAVSALKGELGYKYGPNSKPSDIDSKIKIFDDKFVGVNKLVSDLGSKSENIQGLNADAASAYAKLGAGGGFGTHLSVHNTDAIQQAMNDLANYKVTAQADRDRWQATTDSQKESQTAAKALLHLAKPVLERKLVPAFDHQTGQLLKGGGKELMARLKGDTQWRFSDKSDTSAQAQMAAIPGLMQAYTKRQSKSAMPNAIIDSYAKHLAKDKNASGREFLDRLSNHGANWDLSEAVQTYADLQDRIAATKVDPTDPTSVAQMASLQAQRDQTIVDSGYSPEVFLKARHEMQAAQGVADARATADQAKRDKEDAEAATRAQLYASRDTDPVWSAKRHTGGQTVSSNEYLLQNTEGLVLTGSRMEDAIGMLSQISKQGQASTADNMSGLASQFLGRTPEDKTLFHQHSGSVDVNMKGHADFVQQIADAVAGHMSTSSGMPMQGQRVKRAYEA